MRLHGYVLHHQAAARQRILAQGQEALLLLAQGLLERKRVWGIRSKQTTTMVPLIYLQRVCRQNCRACDTTTCQLSGTAAEHLPLLRT